MRRAAATVAALLAVVLLTGCGGEAAVADRDTRTAAPPSPEGATEIRELPGAPDDTSCDPTASYRPTGATVPPTTALTRGWFGPDTSTLAAIRKRGRLIVGVDQSTYNFGYRDPFTGRLEGFDVDLGRAVARAIFGRDDAVQLRALTSSQRVAAVKNGDVDLVVRTMRMDCERWREIDFSTAYFETGQRVLVRKGSGHTGLDSLGGRKVCATAGSTSIRDVLRAPSKPIGVQVAEWTDCLVMLQQKQVEAVSTDEPILAGLALQDPFTEVVGPSFAVQQYGMAIAKGRTDFVRFVNAVLDQVRTSGEWSRLYDRWLTRLLGRDASPPAPRYRD